MAKAFIDTTTLEGIANAIRSKNGTTNTYLPSEMANAILAISSGDSTTKLQSKSVTPTESAQTVQPDSGYDGLMQVSVGAISNTYVGSGIARKSSSSLISNGATVNVPAGYYSENASKTVDSTTLATPSISVDSSGLITATENQTTGGYIEIDTKSATKQLPTKSAETITPTTTNQTISSGQYLIGTQTIKGDANLVSSNILSGVSIFGVSGSIVIQKYYTGSADPSSSLGNDGDLYLKVG